MQVVFLGGASQVGASCLAIEIAGRWLVVDAGVRLSPGADPLPDLAFLQDKPVVAALVTHAHADHIGALPLLHQAFPTIPIYTSLATGRLMEVMLRDSLKVMAMRARTELEIPLYDPPLVEAMLRQVRVLPLTGVQALAELPAVTLHTVPAGHVAGAISFGLDTPEGRLVISGDVSLTPQRTVSPARLPDLRQPDLLILESTYGGRLHANRQAEEARLVAALGQHLQRGSVLIPAFALGRAQEVLLILAAAHRAGTLPAHPIWVDGLVRTVCAAYTSIPAALHPTLAAQILRGGMPFFTDIIRPVRSPDERAKILAGPPACLVSSSGMLTGGPSAGYAAALAGNADAAILLTGYQDEESPGARVLALATDHRGTLDLGGRAVTVRCRVEKYNLSAHADQGELVRLVRTLQPRQVALVHGEPTARAALAAALGEQTTVLLPQEGEVLVVRAPGARHRAPAPPPTFLAGGTDDLAPDLNTVATLWENLVRAGHGGTALPVADLAARRYGSQLSPEQIAAFQAVLDAAPACFQPVADRPGLYMVQPGATPVTPGARPRLPAAAIHAQIQAVLGHAPDLHKVAVHPRTGAVTLQFHFPLVARRRYAAALTTLQAQLGVLITVLATPHPPALLAQATAVLPEGWRAAQGPTLELNPRRVRLACVGPLDPALRKAAQQRFLETTGVTLKIEELPPLPAGALVPPADTPRLDQMTADQRLRAALGPESGLYKVGAHPAQGLLTLRFHFPARAAVRYHAALVALAAETGWALTIAPYAHQGMLEEAARASCPPGVRLTGGPVIRQAAQEVVLEYDATAEGDPAAGSAARAAAAQAFEEQTGWQLVWCPADPAPPQDLAPGGTQDDNPSRL